jgi:hypothetical protein
MTMMVGWMGLDLALAFGLNGMGGAKQTLSLYIGNQSGFPVFEVHSNK